MAGALCWPGRTGESRKQKAETDNALKRGLAAGRNHTALEMWETGATFVHAVMRGRIALWGERENWKLLIERGL